MENIQLKLTDHADSVKAFFRHFSLRERLPERLFLQEILEKFAAIPYENISKIIKLNQTWETPQERFRFPEELFAQHRAHKLGGTCFSLTYYLKAVLERNGFSCYPVMADMRAGKNIHCALVVILDAASYLVDPGYLLSQPMKMRSTKRKMYKTEFAGVELCYDAATDWFHLYTFNIGKTTWRYRFRNRPVPTEEFLQHWQASFNGNSMHNICLTKVHKNGLLYIREAFMRETTFDEKRNFNIKKNYHQTIFDRFGVEKEIVERAQTALEENLSEEKKRGLWVPKGS